MEQQYVGLKKIIKKRLQKENDTLLEIERGVIEKIVQKQEKYVYSEQEKKRFAWKSKYLPP